MNESVTELFLSRNDCGLIDRWCQTNAVRLIEILLFADDVQCHDVHVQSEGFFQNCRLRFASLLSVSKIKDTVLLLVVC